MITNTAQRDDYPHSTFAPADDVYSALVWRDLNRDLAEALSGCRIIGTDLIDYPLTDEIDIYLQDVGGQLFALRAGTDPDDPAAVFYAQIARLPDLFTDDDCI